MWRYDETKAEKIQNLLWTAVRCLLSQNRLSKWRSKWQRCNMQIGIYKKYNMPITCVSVTVSVFVWECEWVGLYIYEAKNLSSPSQQIAKTFEVCDLPVRAAKFVARKHWVLTGSDDMKVRVFNYNTLERVHQFDAHADYIRSLAVHPTNSFLLTSRWTFESSKVSMSLNCVSELFPCR